MVNSLYIVSDSPELTKTYNKNKSFFIFSLIHKQAINIFFVPQVTDIYVDRIGEKVTEYSAFQILGNKNKIAIN